MLCDKCGFENREGAIVCEHCGALLIQSPPQTAEKSSGTTGSYSDAPVNGYRSYTKGGTSQSSPQRSPFTGAMSAGSREWVAYAAIICGALAIYSSPTVIPGILLGISAIIFGIVGLKTSKRTMSLIGIIAGAIGSVFSVLVIGAIIGFFNLIASYFTRGYGWPFGW